MIIVFVAYRKSGTRDTGSLGGTLRWDPNVGQGEALRWNPKVGP